ncbi:MAG: ABC transporter permease [Salegentibacter sp.]|uniref:Transport permease protein n=1 Tax=Salegentibacter flavus TaxID=287099 RepID=A0A1I5AEZ0_9FLAO|nr:MULTISPECIES: ABC transporter permease [Salegentibacter]MDR9457117.1 ABC transporter permease [Salegentibacter sp.]SFN61056.1 ABC-2 type transporter [Salegentibacter flavus]
MRFLSVIIIFLLTFSMEAQQVLSLEESYELAEKNYPLARQGELLGNKTEAEVSEIQKDKLPRIDLNAQAHYQSEVISFPFQLPNTTMETPNNDVPFVGNIGLIYLFTAVYLLVILGMGLFISNYTDTQQQAMFIAWFFMVVFILMSGLFTPIESMPDWAQKLTLLNPIRYFVEVIRMVMLKGSGLGDILWQFGVMSFFAVVLNALAVWSYRKTQ